MRIHCACKREVEAEQVVAADVIGCMVYRVRRHMINPTITCAKSGNFVNLHPRGVGEFVESLRTLREMRPELFNERGDISVLNLQPVPQLVSA